MTYAGVGNGVGAAGDDGGDNDGFAGSGTHTLL